MVVPKVLLILVNSVLITASKDGYDKFVASFKEEVDGSVAKNLLLKRLSDLDTARSQWQGVKDPDIQAVQQLVHHQYLLLVDINKCGLNLNSQFANWLKNDMDNKVQNMNYSVKKSSEASAQQKAACKKTTDKLHYDFLNFGGAIDYNQFKKDIAEAKQAFQNLNCVKYIDESQ